MESKCDNQTEREAAVALERSVRHPNIPLFQSKKWPPSLRQEDNFYYAIWQHRDGRKIRYERGIMALGSYGDTMREVGWCQFCAGEVEWGNSNGPKWMSTSPRFYEAGPYCETCKPIVAQRHEIMRRIGELQRTLEALVPTVRLTDGENPK